MNLNINSLNFIISRKFIILIIFFLFILLYFESLQDFYNSHFVVPFMMDLKPSVRINFVFCLLCIIVNLGFIYSARKGVKVSDAFFFICFVLVLLFSYIRVNDDYYFFPDTPTGGVKYFDVLFVVLEAFILLKVRSLIVKEKSPNYYNDPFLVDLPVNSKEDIFYRVEFAEKLARKIQSINYSGATGSLAIGINGEWGSGKTTFCGFIKEKIDKKNRIIIDFNPWKSSSSKKIIEDFFSTLISELKIIDPNLSDELTSYARSLTSIDENIITKGFRSVLEYILDDSGRIENYVKINDSIKKSRRQIIIFIDDLDRLDKSEIIETLRLIRNTASFNSIVYVVSYDKDYVLEAIRSFNKHQYNNFLEKIFQFEFYLPKYDVAILRNSLKELLKSQLSNTYFNEIDASVDYAGISGTNITSRVIKSQRDVIRFVNAFVFEFKQVQHEVTLVDFYIIQLLKLKFQAVYKYFSDNFEALLIKDGERLRLRLLSEAKLNPETAGIVRILNSEKDKNLKNSTLEPSLFEQYINESNPSTISDIDKMLVIELVNELLIEKYFPNRNNSIDYRAFGFSQNVSKYFGLQILSSDFPYQEFENIRVADYSTYKDKVMSWISRGRISDLMQRFEKLKDFATKTEWENHLKILVEVGKYQLATKAQFGINYIQIIEVLSYPYPELSAQRKKKPFFFNSAEDFENYVETFFDNAPDPYVFESNILTTSMVNNIYLPISNDSRDKKIVDYFKKYCSNHQEITNDFRILHRNAISKNKYKVYDDKDNTSVQNLFKEYFLKYLKGNQLAGFITHSSPNSDFFEIDYKWAKEIFEEPIYENIESYLISNSVLQEERDYYNEFVVFFHKLKENNFKPIEFIFNHLVPSLWSGGTRSNPTE